MKSWKVRAAAVGIAVVTVFLLAPSAGIAQPDAPRMKAATVTVLDRAEEMGVPVVVVPAPCGWTTEEGGVYPGCYNDGTIELSPGMNRNAFNYVVLLNLAYAQQDRAGEEHDNCTADAQAVKWGAKFTGWGCPGLPSWDTTKLWGRQGPSPLYKELEAF